MKRSYANVTGTSDAAAAAAAVTTDVQPRAQHQDATFSHPHAFANLGGGVIMCTKCGRTPVDVQAAPANQKLCLAPTEIGVQATAHTTAAPRAAVAVAAGAGRDPPSAPPAAAPASAPMPVTGSQLAPHAPETVRSLFGALPAGIALMRPARVAANTAQQQFGGFAATGNAAAMAATVFAPGIDHVLPRITYDDVDKAANERLVRNGRAVLLQHSSFQITATASNFPAGKPAARWRVVPNLPRGIQINVASGTIRGEQLDSGGAYPEITSYSITAASADGSAAASVQLILHFVESALRNDMGNCLGCGVDSVDEIGQRTVACSTTTAAKPHGVHIYCNACFNAYVMTLVPNQVPLECMACRDPSVPHKVAVLFNDDEIMPGLTDATRVRYVTMIKARQAPGTVRVKCGVRGCTWEADVPEAQRGDYVVCQRPACRKTTCRKCELSLELEGQDEKKLQIASRSEARKINERNNLIAQTHLISCALELRIEEICALGLAVPCPACGVRTQKDDSCTHMVCGNRKCGTRYCYCCGKARVHCDGARQDAWGNHNLGWETNVQRCPMYLQHLAQQGRGNRILPVGSAPVAAAGVGAAAASAVGVGVGVAAAGAQVAVVAAAATDSVWPDNAHSSLALFHQERILRELQKLLRHANREQAEPLVIAARGANALAQILEFQERPWFRNRPLPPL